MAEEVAALFVRLAELAAATGATPEDSSGIHGVWTTTVPARNRDDDWQIAMNCDTGTEHTVSGFPAAGNTPTLRPGSVTVWLGTIPAGVCTPFDGAVVIQETIDGPTRIEDELLGDIEARLQTIEAGATTGEPVASVGGEP